MCLQLRGAIELLKPFIIIFLAGLSLKFIIVSIFGFLLALPYFWSTLHLYQQNRVLSLIDSARDPLGAGYHSIQSMIAIGSGGFLGKGWSYGSQTQLNFLRKKPISLMYPFNELLHLVVGILIIYFFGSSCIDMAKKMQNTFSRLITAALTFTLFISTFVNIAMVSGVIPIVGAPLPFVSYGGTSMVVSLSMIGIIMSLHSHKSLIAN